MSKDDWDFPPPASDQLKNAVLLTTGSMNPTHKGHVDMLRLAKLELEKDGWNVCAAFLSPSHDLYLRSKMMGFNFVPATQRITMANLAVQNYPWLYISDWESSQKGYWPDFTEVIDSLKQAITDRGISAHTFYVCGSDHARYCWDLNELVVIARAQQQGISHTPHHHQYYIKATQNLYLTCSSTTVRKLLLTPNPQDQLSAKALLGVEVYTYIQDHKLYRP